MDEHMESGSIPEEPGESDAEGDLARGSDLGSPSPGALRQRTSMPVSALPPEGQDPEAALESSLEEQIEAAVERRFQKAKDRRLTRLERELEAVKELVALRKATNQGAGRVKYCPPNLWENVRARPGPSTWWSRELADPISCTTFTSGRSTGCKAFATS